LYGRARHPHGDRGELGFPRHLLHKWRRVLGHGDRRGNGDIHPRQSERCLRQRSLRWLVRWVLQQQDRRPALHQHFQPEGVRRLAPRRSRDRALEHERHWRSHRLLRQDEPDLRI